MMAALLKSPHHVFTWGLVSILVAVFSRDGCCVMAELPQELDPFLAVLFETEECESFLADGKFLSVATSECKPHVCDFPRQLCMRPAPQYNDESANECRDLPLKCLTAANGGVPVPNHSKLRPTSMTVVATTEESAIEVGATEEEASSSGRRREDGLVDGSAKIRPSATKLSICEQGVPEGRFCGFALKFAFNRETGSCDQFWFPGCRTADTNDNLFNSLAECRQATTHCRIGVGVPSPTVPPTPYSSSPIFITTYRPDVTVPINGRYHGGGFVPQPQMTLSPYGNQGQLPNFNGGAGGLSQLLTGGGGGGPGGGFGGLLQGLTGGGGGAGSSPQGPSVSAGNIGGSEYGGGALGSGGGVTQPPNLIRLIANTIREVKDNGGNGRLDPNQFAGFLQSAFG